MPPNGGLFIWHLKGKVSCPHFRAQQSDYLKSENGSKMQQSRRQSTHGGPFFGPNRYAQHCSRYCRNVSSRCLCSCKASVVEHHLVFHTYGGCTASLCQSEKWGSSGQNALPIESCVLVGYEECLHAEDCTAPNELSATA